MTASPRAPRAIARVTLRLVPLTPVHIGDGTEIRPDEYLIRGSGRAELCRFDQTKAMRAMTMPELTAFRAALDRGDLAAAAKELRAAGARTGPDRVPLSPHAQLREAMERPLARSGEVRPFVRSGGRPYIPGSSIKGAFRTALASAMLPRDARAPGHWTHDAALQAAFGLDPNDTATDPLRFLHVSDAPLPEGATLIDRSEVVKTGGEPASSGGRGSGIQMHFERTRALTDGEDAPAFEAGLGLDARALDDREVRRREARFNAEGLLRVCRIFHSRLFNEEIRRFFDEDAGKRLRGLLVRHRAPDGRMPVTDGRYHPDFVLLRLGRFGHFESKSLEGVRRGHFPQARNPADRMRPPNAWGTTRTVTRDRDNNPVPFGWVIGWVVKEERP